MLLSLVGYWAFGPMVYEPSTTNVQNPIDWIYRWICWWERHTASLNGHKPQVALSNIAFSMPCCSIFSSNMLYIWNITCCAITRAASSCFVIKIICLSRTMASERSCVCARAREQIQCTLAIMNAFIYRQIYNKKQKKIYQTDVRPILSSPSLPV